MTFALILAMAATVAVQRWLGLPGGPPGAALVLLPMPWIVGPALRTADRRWFAASFGLGVVWDLVVLEPVVGPGGIAWSAASAVAWWLAGAIADRGPRLWFASGALAAATFWVVRFAAHWPLGVARPLTLFNLGVSALLTGSLCGAVGLALDMDLAARWRRHRARRLR